MLLIPLLYLVGLADISQSDSRFTSTIAVLFKSAGLPLTLSTVLIVYIGVVSLRAVVQRYQSILNVRIQQGFTQELRNRLYEAITYADWLFISRSRASDITHSLTTELQRIGSATQQFLLLVSTLAAIIIHVTMAFMLSPLMTALALGAAGVLLFVLRPQNRRVHDIGKAMRRSTLDIYATITEHFGGLKEVKSYGVEKRHVNEFKERCEAVKNENIRFTQVTAKTGLYFEIGTVVALSLFIYGAVEIVNIHVTELLLLIYLFARLLPKISIMHRTYLSIISMLPAFDAVMKLKNECTDAREPQLTLTTDMIKFERCIELRQVSFRYRKERDIYALHKADLIIPARQMTGIAGPSGAGKSTLANMLIGLLVPENGIVSVDNVPLIDGKQRAWRQSVGYVPQESFLFNNTIRYNLLWARPDATEEEIKHSLKMAAADIFVEELPHGIDTVIGDRGIKLSGGERQRIALARAILRKPLLLLLDEATSALDTENERRIQEAINRLHGELTIVVIAHRLSTLRNADHIVVLENGSVVESGTWDQLCIQPYGRFQNLLRADTRT